MLDENLENERLIKNKIAWKDNSGYSHESIIDNDINNNKTCTPHDTLVLPQAYSLSSVCGTVASTSLHPAASTVGFCARTSTFAYLEYDG